MNVQPTQHQQTQAQARAVALLATLITRGLPPLAWRMDPEGRLYGTYYLHDGDNAAIFTAWREALGGGPQDTWGYIYKGAQRVDQHLHVTVYGVPVTVDVASDAQASQDVA